VDEAKKALKECQEKPAEKENDWWSDWDWFA